VLLLLLLLLLLVVVVVVAKVAEQLVARVVRVSPSNP
jgi:hypothetical protein